jgi:hypothetical protein
MNIGTDDWNQFSCIHSTCTDRFSFIVYTSSHKLKDNENVNPRSRIELSFPKNSSYFIIFHGQLVHSGASSQVDEDGDIIKSARMFSYLKVPEHNATFNGNFRRSSRLKTYTSKLKEGKVDRNTFSMMKESDDNYPPFKIELPSNALGLKTNTINVIPVIGNINLDGWEVYEGINFSSHNLKQHSEDLDKLIGMESIWKGISSTKRKIYVLFSIDSIENKVLFDLRKLYNAFDDLLLKRLRKIPYLDEVELENKAIIANLGYVHEQEPHRDFSSVKK